MPTIWIAQLLISDRTAGKIRSKHGIEPYEVRAAVIGQSGLSFAWHVHPDRGRRAILNNVTIGSRRVAIVLYPADGGMNEVWHLGSVYPI